VSSEEGSQTFILISTAYCISQVEECLKEMPRSEVEEGSNQPDGKLYEKQNRWIAMKPRLGVEWIYC